MVRRDGVSVLIVWSRFSRGVMLATATTQMKYWTPSAQVRSASKIVRDADESIAETNRTIIQNFGPLAARGRSPLPAP
jgi:hypothetical protein